jgi:hypothetical protein
MAAGPFCRFAVDNFNFNDPAFSFWQVRVCDQDIHKTAFKALDGQMKCVAMPFGLCNAPATF